MTSPNSTRSRRLGRATLTFVAFPVGGSLAHLLAGRIDSPAAALVGGLLAGAAIGAGQALGSSGRLPLVRWTVGSSLGLAAGLTAGAALVDYDTSLRALAAMGAVSGAGVGAGQALAWGARVSRRTRGAWSALVPALWALGWTITTAIGVDVDLQWAVFGSAGAVVASAGLAAALETAAPARAGGAPVRTEVAA
ncbi:MAG: hypothetical protein AAGC46_18405 [Solirubrobacteraceae bacterium]|nr:hypothetical protein [Patulibacter sp.]